MKQQDRLTATSSLAIVPRTDARGPEVFHRAVEVLKAKHHVSNAAAYAMLVQGAVTSGTTVREAATAVLRAALATR
jgi:AmiR/NasT family two-component response regulator